MLNVERQFPDTFDELQRLCHDKNQTKPTVLILKYGKGEYNMLHQDIYGNIFFPFQLVFFLNEPWLRLIFLIIALVVFISHKDCVRYQKG